jgi:hypothetical protein
MGYLQVCVATVMNEAPWDVLSYQTELEISMRLLMRVKRKTEFLD